ncbi:MAG: histidine kinase, partial [Bacteroidales bacterium]|nr:histidine kinase [Bacteroidales bacterium]
ASQVYQIETEAKLAEYYQKNNMAEQEIVSRNSIINDLEENREELKKEKLDVDGRIAEEKLNLASVYISGNQLNEAFSVLDDMPDILEKKKDKTSLEFKKEIAKLRSQAFLKSGQKEEALKSYEEYAAILDELYSQSELEYKDITQLNNQLRDHQWRIDFLEKDKQIYDAEIEMIAKESELKEEKLSYQRTFIILLSGLILLLLAFIIVLIARMRIQKKHNSYLALKSLRTQMNPHFIFNALNSINHFIVKNDERNANKFLGKFAKLMRDILQNSEADFIPVKQEIEMIRHYLELEYMRFPDKFKYEFLIQEELENSDFEIPPMILQPYIENAVWHGLRYLESDGKLSVKMEKAEKSLRVIIEDNGIGRAKSASLKTKNQLEHKSKGLTNTSGRLKILSRLYGKEIHVEITDLHPDGTGTRVELVLPLMKIHT